jgi:hypothetical protein
MDDQTDAGKQIEDALVECEKRVQHLEKENADLRNAAQTFGDLAERLNTRLLARTNAGSRGRVSEKCARAK